MGALLFADLVPMATHGRPLVHMAMVTGGDVAIAAIVMGCTTAILTPLVRAFARRWERGLSDGAQMPSLRQVEDRLDRIERAVDSIAIEVERVSEGQRFVTKLLAEKSAPQLPSENR